MKKFVFPAVLLFIFISCSKKKGNTPEPTSPVKPGAAELVFPYDNQLCTHGTNPTDSISTINFQWNNGSNTDTFVLHFENLLTKVVDSESTTATTLAVALSKETPYSWFVVSHSSKSRLTASSPVWKFYNAGNGTLSYPPFPADLTSPIYGQNIAPGRVNLTWKCNVVVGDSILNYDIYFGANSTPPLLQRAVSNNFLDNVTINSGNTYYWKVVTRDRAGNTTPSSIFYFTVN